MSDFITENTGEVVRFEQLALSELPSEANSLELVAEKPVARDQFEKHFSLRKLLESIDANLVDAAASLCVGVALNPSNFLLMARGGNYKVTRENLQKQGKLNGKQKMPIEQKKLRRRKRKR